MYIGEWTELDEKNKRLIEEMKRKGEIAYGLADNNVAITLNNLIDFCKEQKIDFDKPILLECPDGYFPLSYYHNGVSYNENGEEYNLNVLVITDGKF